MKDLKKLSRNKAILTFEDVHGITAAQLKKNQVEVASKEREEQEERGAWKSCE